MWDIIAGIVQDGVFAAIAAIGFGTISNTPKIALKYCGLIAALGHVTRYCLTRFAGVGIVFASLIGAVVVGGLAVVLAPRAKCPPETFSFPSLLPMIPGIYAYRAIQAFILALTAVGEEQFSHYFYLCESNGITCVFIILGMVIGQMIPVIVFKRLTYTATRG